jgi:hypothetical protein
VSYLITFIAGVITMFPALVIIGTWQSLRGEPVFCLKRREKVVASAARAKRNVPEVNS